MEVNGLGTNETGILLWSMENHTISRMRREGYVTESTALYVSFTGRQNRLVVENQFDVSPIVVCFFFEKIGHMNLEHNL